MVAIFILILSFLNILSINLLIKIDYLILTKNKIRNKIFKINKKS